MTNEQKPSSKSKSIKGNGGRVDMQPPPMPRGWRPKPQTQAELRAYLDKAMREKLDELAKNKRPSSAVQRRWMKAVERLLLGMMSGLLEPREVMRDMLGSKGEREIRALHRVWFAARRIQTHRASHPKEGVWRGVFDAERVEWLIWELSEYCDARFKRLDRKETIRLLARMNGSPDHKGGTGKYDPPAVVARLAVSVGAFGYRDVEKATAAFLAAAALSPPAPWITA